MSIFHVNFLDLQAFWAPALRAKLTLIINYNDLINKRSKVSKFGRLCTKCSFANRFGIDELNVELSYILYSGVPYEYLKGGK